MDGRQVERWGIGVSNCGWGQHSILSCVIFGLFWFKKHCLYFFLDEISSKPLNFFKASKNPRYLCSVVLMRSFSLVTVLWYIMLCYMLCYVMKCYMCNVMHNEILQCSWNSQSIWRYLGRSMYLACLQVLKNMPRSSILPWTKTGLCLLVWRIGICCPRLSSNLILCYN